MSRAPFKLHPLHRAWRMLPAHRRRALFASLTALAAPRIDRTPPAPEAGLAVAGELSSASGLGMGARLMRAALDSLAIPNWGLDTGDRLPGAGPPRVIQRPPPAAPLVVHINAPLMPWALLRLPRDIARNRRIIGYWAWELPVVPESWRVGLRFVHEVWVPSHFTADALRPMLPKHGRIALRVVPHPVAVAPPQPSGLDRAAFGWPADAVVVLCAFNLASSFVRKNPLAAIAAHRAAFSGRKDRILVLKIGNTGHFPADFEAIRSAIGDAPNILLETRTLPEADSHAMTACADIVLSLHRSEGFGLVPAEAMLLGRPVVATGWSGNTDFMDDGSAALVPCRLVPATDPRGVLAAPGAVWAEPDIGAAAAHLLRLADDPAARAALGAAGRAMARARLGAGPLAAAVAGLGLVAGTRAA